MLRPITAPQKGLPVRSLFFAAVLAASSALAADSYCTAAAKMKAKQCMQQCAEDYSTSSRDYTVCMQACVEDAKFDMASCR
jgi:hypothetical protein